MKINIRAATKQDYIPTNEEINLLSGSAAGTCYMPHNFETLKGELVEKTLKRAEMTKKSGHHSVFGHQYITLELENIPKLFALLLNNEKLYNTSEKSARYTKMQLPELEERLYKKWCNKFEELIENKYGKVSYFTKNRILKLAMENARYLTSVMTPTSMLYTTSYQQLNYICGWLKTFKDSEIALYKMLVPTADEFLQKMNDLNLLDNDLMNDGKNRTFSLVGRRIRQEEFGENYSVNYNATFASFGQLQRHRTLSYEINQYKDFQFYTPEIIKSNPDLVYEWTHDMYSVSRFVPQGEILKINERGTYENLILKAKERLCTAAQLEVVKTAKENIERYIKNTDNQFVKQELEKINTGARCTSGYKCATPCAFKEGIDLTRII